MKKKSLSKFFWTLLGICIFMYCIFVVSRRALTDYFVDEKALQTKALIINEENVYPNQRGINSEFSYSYQFEVNGKKYKGNSHDRSLKIGDTVEVKYYSRCPYFNKPAHPKD